MDPHQKLRNKITAKIEDPTTSVPVELAAAVHADLAEHEAVIEEACDAKGHVQVTLRVLEREKTKLQADKPSEHRYDGDREEPLCDCPDPYCTIKKGNVPLEIKEADSYDEGEREFRENHDGDPLVLKDAAEEVVEAKSEAMVVLRRNLMALQWEVHPDEIADYAEMDKDELAAAIDSGEQAEATGD